MYSPEFMPCWGISPEAIYSMIGNGDLDATLGEVHYGPPPPAPTKLDPVQAIITARLADLPDLAGVRYSRRFRRRIPAGSRSYESTSVSPARPDGAIAAEGWWLSYWRRGHPAPALLTVRARRRGQPIDGCHETPRFRSENRRSKSAAAWFKKLRL